MKKAVETHFYQRQMQKKKKMKTVFDSKLALQIMEQIIPVSPKEWETVTRLYNQLGFANIKAKSFMERVKKMSHSAKSTMELNGIRSILKRTSEKNENNTILPTESMEDDEIISILIANSQEAKTEEMKDELPDTIEDPVEISYPQDSSSISDQSSYCSPDSSSKLVGENRGKILIKEKQNGGTNKKTSLTALMKEKTKAKATRSKKSRVNNNAWTYH